MIYSSAYTWFNEHLNPAYLALTGYYDEWEAAENGCGLSTVAEYGAEGVLGVVGTGAAATGIEGAGSSLLSGSLGTAAEGVAEGAGPRRLVIGKLADLTAPGAIGPNEYTLFDQLPDLGSEEANWAQNEKALLQEMDSGAPIRDASVSPETGQLTNNTAFLAKERALLESQGWIYSPATHLWSP